MSDFKPKFYWTGNPFEDAERINRPHIKKEGERENRIEKTKELINDLSDFESFTLTDAINIQNSLLKENNWRGIKWGLRTHNVSFKDIPDYTRVESEIRPLFPTPTFNSKEELLEWYTKVQIVHPLSDLNGRVFGIIVSILYKNLNKRKL